jgi:chromosome segregation ATPase
MINEYAIDDGFYAIFEGLNIDEKKIRNFLLNFHSMMNERDNNTKENIQQKTSILKAELKDELVKELATKMDIFEVKKEVEKLDNTIIEFEKRWEVEFENIDIKFDKVNTIVNEFKENIDIKFDKVDSRINEFRENVDIKFDKVNNNIDKFRENVDIKFDRVNSIINEFKEQVDKRFEQVDKRFEQVDKRFEQVDKRLEQIDKRFDKLEDKLDKYNNKIERLLFIIIGTMGSFIVGVIFLLMRFGKFD